MEEVGKQETAKSWELNSNKHKALLKTRTLQFAFFYVRVTLK